MTGRGSTPVTIGGAAALAWIVGYQAGSEAVMAICHVVLLAVIAVAYLANQKHTRHIERDALQDWYRREDEYDRAFMDGYNQRITEERPTRLVSVRSVPTGTDD